MYYGMVKAWLRGAFGLALKESFEPFYVHYGRLISHRNNQFDSILFSCSGASYPPTGILIGGRSKI